MDIKKNKNEIIIESLIWDKEYLNSSTKGIDEFYHNIDIIIPLKYLVNLECKVKIGNVRIDNIQGKSLKVNCGTGSVSLGDIMFNKLDLITNIGDINVNLKRKNGEFRLKAGIGQIYVDIKEFGGDFTFIGGIGESIFKIPVNAPLNIILKTGINKVENRAIISKEYLYNFIICSGIGKVMIIN